MHVRFERSEPAAERAAGFPPVVIFGPYEYVQLTYEEIRVSPDGAPLAHISGGVWLLSDENPEVRNRASAENILHYYSDVVVYEG